MKPEILKWVKIVVLRTVREKSFSALEVDNLLSAGYEGYTQSLKRFDPARGVKFKTFAEYRIKGAVLDEVRKLIGDERCKTPRPTKVDDYDMTQIEQDHADDVGSKIDVERFFDSIPVDKRGKMILKYRVEGLNLREIGEKLGFSESRASQLLAEIKKQVYPWFKEYLGANFKIVDHICPECGHLNEAAEFTTRLDCEKCSIDIVIQDGIARVREAGHA